MTTAERRLEKMNRVFQHFDSDRDGRWNGDEIEAFTLAVNPGVKFSEIMANFFSNYGKFIDCEKGLTFGGFISLCYEDDSIAERAHHFLLGRDRKALADKNGRTAAWAVCPYLSYVSGDTLNLVDELKLLIEWLNLNYSSQVQPEHLEMSDKIVMWDESSADYAAFVKALGVLSLRADRAGSQLEAWEAQMAIGHVLYENCLFKEATVSFVKAHQLLEATVSAYQALEAELSSERAHQLLEATVSAHQALESELSSERRACQALQALEATVKRARQALEAELSSERARQALEAELSYARTRQAFQALEATVNLERARRAHQALEATVSFERTPEALEATVSFAIARVRQARQALEATMSLERALQARQALERTVNLERARQALESPLPSEPSKTAQSCVNQICDHKKDRGESQKKTVYTKKIVFTKCFTWFQFR